MRTIQWGYGKEIKHSQNDINLNANKTNKEYERKKRSYIHKEDF